MDNQFEKLKIEYQEFYQHLCSAYDNLSVLLKSYTEFLILQQEKDILENSFLYELEANLLYLERFLFMLNDVVDEIDNVTISNMKIKIKKEDIKLRNRERDIEMVVDLNYPISDIFKQNSQ